MFKETLRPVYKRLLVLAALCGALAFFTSTTVSEIVYAAACIQDCEAAEAQCYNDCAEVCENTSCPECSDCMTGCATQFRRCMRNAVWCESDPISNTRCEVGFGTHQSGNSYHEGYHQVCPRLIGGGNCVVCPPGEICLNAPEGMPYCY